MSVINNLLIAQVYTTRYKMLAGRQHCSTVYRLTIIFVFYQNNYYFYDIVNVLGHMFLAFLRTQMSLSPAENIFYARVHQLYCYILYCMWIV